jgi:catechol 2,3-dioxygenase-like lactoylglutathione lyase family enzyme
MEVDQYWNPLVPELTVADLERSLQFYVSAGFSVRFRRKPPPFAYLELGHAQLMLEQEHSGGWNFEPLDRPLGRGINFQIEVPNAVQVLTALQSLGVQPFRDVQDTWYAVSALQQEGQREFLVQDPDGYLLRFAQYLGSRSTADKR